MKIKLAGLMALFCISVSSYASCIYGLAVSAKTIPKELIQELEKKQCVEGVPTSQSQTHIVIQEESSMFTDYNYKHHESQPPMIRLRFETTARAYERISGKYLGDGTGKSYGLKGNKPWGSDRLERLASKRALKDLAKKGLNFKIEATGIDVLSDGRTLKH